MKAVILAISLFLPLYFSVACQRKPTRRSLGVRASGAIRNFRAPPDCSATKPPGTTGGVLSSRKKLTALPVLRYDSGS